MTDDLRSYGLAEYLAARDAGRIVEGDTPATDREKVEALTKATERVAESERKWAVENLSARGRGYSFVWDERTGKVWTVGSIEEWDALRAGGVVNHKVDA